MSVDVDDCTSIHIIEHIEIFFQIFQTYIALNLKCNTTSFLSENTWKPIVAFTHNTVFILNFYNVTNSLFGRRFWP